LRELDVSGWYDMGFAEGVEPLGREQLLPILRANAASLLELRAWKPVDGELGFVAATAVVEQLLAAAPRLRLLECDFYLEGWWEARGPLPRLLREPQFAPLRVQKLQIDAGYVQPPPDMQALAAWAATHASLKGLVLSSVHLDSEPALASVADLAILQLQYLTLYICSLSPASLPALMRMLESRSLLGLCIANARMPLLMGAAVPVFCTALRASRLVKLTLNGMRLWESLADGLAVIAACTGHPTLRTLDFRSNDLQHAPGRAAIESALDALQASIPGHYLTR